MLRLRRAHVRNIGEKSATATRVAGSDPLKIMTPRRPLPQPAVVRSMSSAFQSRSISAVRLEQTGTGELQF